MHKSETRQCLHIHLRGSTGTLVEMQMQHSVCRDVEGFVQFERKHRLTAQKPMCTRPQSENSQNDRLKRGGTRTNRNLKEKFDWCLEKVLEALLQIEGGSRKVPYPNIT
jgi:hypothetical protein